nr:MAG TPA: hypothetical protein [Bacteriophage sp.]
MVESIEKNLKIDFIMEKLKYLNIILEELD